MVCALSTDGRGSKLVLTLIHRKVWNKRLFGWMGKLMIRNIKKFSVMEIIAKEYIHCAQCSHPLPPPSLFPLTPSQAVSSRNQRVHCFAINSFCQWCRSSPCGWSLLMGGQQCQTCCLLLRHRPDLLLPFGRSRVHSLVPQRSQSFAQSRHSSGMQEIHTMALHMLCLLKQTTSGF